MLLRSEMQDFTNAFRAKLVRAKLSQGAAAAHTMGKRYLSECLCGGVVMSIQRTRLRLTFPAFRQRLLISEPVRRAVGGLSRTLDDIRASFFLTRSHSKCSSAGSDGRNRTCRLDAGTDPIRGSMYATQ